jgi:hypothetical protein
MILALFIILLTTLLFFYFSYNQRHLKNLPPLYGPDWWTNLQKLTSVTTTSSAQHPHEISRSITGKGVTPKGTVFRLSMVGFPNYIMVTDYLLARIILEGDSKKNIPESEKTTIGRNFDLIYGVGSLFS